jgi:hypothetical protein
MVHVDGDPGTVLWVRGRMQKSGTTFDFEDTTAGVL